MNTITATSDARSEIIEKFKNTADLAKKYSDDIETAFHLELDSFLDNFRDTYHLD